jgi:MFS family permease
MPLKKIFILSVLSFIVGVVVGYFSFSLFQDLLLPGSKSGQTLAVTNPTQFFSTKVLFSVFVGFGFACAPFSALIAYGFSENGRYPVMILSFMALMILSFFAGIAGYRSNFAQLLKELPEGTYIGLDILPYYRIPLISAGITCVAGIIVLIFRRITRSNKVQLLQ